MNDIKAAIETNNNFVVTGPMSYDKMMTIRKCITEKGKTSQIVTLPMSYRAKMTDELEVIESANSADVIILEANREYEELFLERLSLLTNKQFIFSVESLNQPHYLLSPFYNTDDDALWAWIKENNMMTLELYPL